MPMFRIVGLPDKAVQEASERVRSAIRNAGFEFPLRRITVNLAPADVRKEGPIYDLPIAIAMFWPFTASVASTINCWVRPPTLYPKRDEGFRLS